MVFRGDYGLGYFLLWGIENRKYSSMPILSISEHLEPYKILKTQSVLPNSKMEVLLEVRLHKKVISTGLVKNIREQPVIAFYTTTDHTEILEKDWTQQMKKIALAYAKEYPVPDAGKKYSLLGKIIFSTAIIGVISACTVIFYLMYFGGPQLKINIEEFVSLPKKGDRFYGLVNQTRDNGTTPVLAHGWIKIVAVNPTDSTCVYVTSSALGEITFDTLKAEYTSFTNTEIQGKFIANKSNQKVIVISKDKRSRFDAQVLNNETKNYKITAE